MSDVIRQIEAWLQTEPNATEVIIIRRRDNDFAVKIEYGDRTTVPHVDPDLTVALSSAVGKASRMPSGARDKAEKAARKKKTKVEGFKLPGME